MNNNLPDWIETRTPVETQRIFDELRLRLALAENGYKESLHQKIINRMYQLGLTIDDAITKIKNK